MPASDNPFDAMPVIAPSPRVRVPATFTCRACHAPITHTRPVTRDTALCDVCVSSYFVCSNCMRVTQTQHVSDTAGMCCTCDCRGLIQSYSHKPVLVPLGEGRPMGVELEMECQSGSDSEYLRFAKRLHNLFPRDFMITKEDGSLSYGYEICTRPASYEEHRKAWEPVFVAKDAGQFNGLVSYSSDNCGLHVHISRENVSQHAIALMVCFCNLPKNRRFVQVIANRSPNRYTQFKAKRMANAAWSTGDKYEAVNLNHPETIEFRIFKGTMRRSSFFKALEFVRALTEFCTGTYNTRIALSVSAFIRFVKANESDYRYLAAYIDNRWYGKPSRVFNTQLWSLKNNHNPPPPPPEFNNDGRSH